MPRSIPGRLFGALFALWFTVLTVEPARLHVCPMHDGAGHAASSAPTAHQHHAPETAGHETGAPQAHGGCMCLGKCATVAPVASPIAIGVATIERAARDPGLPDYEYVPVHVAHQIPFANGPPAA